jgi:hypothetical protein
MANSSTASVRPESLNNAFRPLTVTVGAPSALSTASSGLTANPWPYILEQQLECMMLVIFCVRIWSEHHCAGTTSVDLGEPIDSSRLFGMKAAAFIGF